MLSINQYKESLEAFSNMDLSTSRVVFSNEKVDYYRENPCDIVIPKIEQKPSGSSSVVQKVFKLIQQIFFRFFGLFFNSIQARADLDRDQTAENLCLMSTQAEHILYSHAEIDSFEGRVPGYSLQHKMFQVSSQIFRKLKKACYRKAMIKHYERTARNKVYTPELRAFVASHSSFQTIKPDFINLCNRSNLELGKCEVVYSENWHENKPIFNEVYARGLINHAAAHPDLRDNKSITVKDEVVLLEFLKNLTTKNQLTVEYNSTPLSVENTTILRKMIYAILNTLNEKRTELDFKDQFATVVFQICRALENCSNGVNSNVERIFTQLTYPKDGAFGQQVKLALQQAREEIFRMAISHCILTSDLPDYYLKHEAATVNHYFGKISLLTEIGLPVSVSRLDKNWEKWYALKDQDDKIKEFFYKHYTPARILHIIWERIFECDSDKKRSMQIPRQLLSNWVLGNIPIEEREGLLDGNYNYTPEGLLSCLQHLEVIQ